jgi:TRAP-type C4-dicarboxylate transport system permease small subunit
MILQKIENGLNRVVEPVSRVLTYIGAGILAVMMFLTAMDVILRYIFSRPIKGTFEITAFMMAIVVSFALAYCAVKKGHITVDILVMHLPRRIQAAVGIFGHFATLVFLTLVMWQCYEYIFTIYKSNTLATTLPIPYYPFVAATAMGLSAFYLVAIRDLVSYLRKALGHGV